MNGAENTAQLLKELLRQRHTRATSHSEKRTGATPDWLLPVRETLDGLAQPASLFFRDDDCGWSDDRLLLLLDIFADFGFPVDLAAIPAALNSAFAQKLSRRMAAHPERLRIHQHGYAHSTTSLRARNVSSALQETTFPSAVTLKVVSAVWLICLGQRRTRFSRRHGTAARP